MFQFGEPSPQQPAHWFGTLDAFSEHVTGSASGSTSTTGFAAPAPASAAPIGTGAGSTLTGFAAPPPALAVPGHDSTEISDEQAIAKLNLCVDRWTTASPASLSALLKSRGFEVSNERLKHLQDQAKFGESALPLQHEQLQAAASEPAPDLLAESREQRDERKSSFRA